MWTARASVSTSQVQGDDSSGNPDLSADGRFVAFESAASNLVPGNVEGGIFVRDNLTGVVGCVDITSSGTTSDLASIAPSISEDGRYVAFSSAGQLAPDEHPGQWDVFVHDPTTRTTEHVEGQGFNYVQDAGPQVSATGRFVAWPAPNSNVVSVYDLDTDTVDFSLTVDVPR